MINRRSFTRQQRRSSDRPFMRPFSLATRIRMSNAARRRSNSVTPESSAKARASLSWNVTPAAI